MVLHHVVLTYHLDQPLPVTTTLFLTTLHSPDLRSRAMDTCAIPVGLTELTLLERKQSIVESIEFQNSRMEQNTLTKVHQYEKANTDKTSVDVQGLPTVLDQHFILYFRLMLGLLHLTCKKDYTTGLRRRTASHQGGCLSVPFESQ
ncbi:hypothetical protein MHYP_G00358910 [Metynnis hypsauchen]